VPTIQAVPTVTTFRLVTAGQMVPNEAAAPWLAPVASPGRLAPGSDPAVLPADGLIADHHNNRLLIVDRYGRIRWEFPRPGRVSWSANPPGVLYPSDTNEVYPGRYLTADYSDPGQIVEFTSSGRLLRRMGVQPALAGPAVARR
jgi:hypothetical protein